MPLSSLSLQRARDFKLNRKERSMRRVLLVVVLIVAAAVLGLWRTNGGVRQGLSKAIGMSSDDSQGEARDEIRKSFQLQPGARIEVRGINGSVEVQTSDTKTVEVYVLRRGSSREALNRREIIIEQMMNTLVVHGESRRAGFWEHLFGHSPNEEVTIKAPRQIALTLSGVNGRVSSGDIEGALELRGGNGKKGRRRQKVKAVRKPQRSAGQGYEGSSHSRPALAGWQRKKIPPNRFNGFVARSKPLERLTIRQCSLTATQLKGVNEKETI